MLSKLKFFFTILISSHSFGQDSAYIQTEAESYSVHFPSTPEFSLDSVNSDGEVVYTNYTLEVNDSLSFGFISRERIPEDNKKETFQNEMDYLSYWTRAQFSEEKKRRIKGNPTYQFTAKTYIYTYYFLVVLTKTHVIRVLAGIKGEEYKAAALEFIDSFEIVK